MPLPDCVFFYAPVRGVGGLCLALVFALCGSHFLSEKSLRVDLVIAKGHDDTMI
jgi:hypothetical protein